MGAKPDPASDERFELFISASEMDAPWVKGFLEPALAAANVRYLTEAAFQPGVPWITQLEGAVARSERVLLVLSRAYLVDDRTAFVELLAQTFGLDSSTWPVIPLLLPGVERDELPLRLRMLTPIDASSAAAMEEAVARVAAAVGRPWPGPTEVPPPPYPGMRTYTRAEADRFRGRDSEVDDLVHLLQVGRCICVVGPSGSGKSSLVEAGLIPRLTSGKVSSFGAGGWTVRTFRPGDGTLALAPAGGTAAGDSGGRSLIVIDQLEELFTTASAEADAFQEELHRVAKDGATYLVLTVRADFYGDLMAAPLWRDVRDHMYPLAPLDEDGLARAIREPAEAVGVYIEAALVERLVADAGREAGILPFVQETMRLLWDRVERRFLPLTAYATLVLPRSAYGKRTPSTITGLEAAIAIRAEATWASLADDERAVARRVFVRLVQFGEGRPDTRRRVSVDRLRARESPEIFDRTLTQLAAPEHRLITLSGSPDEQERMVELAHDALIGAWPRFQEWLEEFRVDERTRRDVERDVREWRDRVDDPSRLYEGSQLAEAHTWAAANQQDVDRDTDTFLKASDRRAGRRRSARVTLGALVLAFTLIGVGATGYVVRQAVLNQSARGETVDFQAVSARLGSGPSPDLTTYRGVDTVVNVPAFSLDRYEVTNGQYRRCVDAGFCTQPSEPAETVSYTVAGDDLPVVWVTAYQAARFCDWIGRRLPTEMEWERAARGAEGRAWPWGNDPPSPTRANVILEAFPPTSDPALVSVRDPAYAMGATPEGVAHLLGNAWEWTASPRECTNPYACPGAWNGHDPVSSLYARGLSFRVPLSDIDVGGSARATLGKSWLLDGYYADADLGFRCASTRG